jgi:oligopeptidase A
MFRVVETIFGVTMREASAPVWHPSVRFFDVLDRDGAVVGQFYLDLYARVGKRGGAWMDDAISRRRHGQSCSIRSPISPATSRAPSATGRRCLRTTK